MRTIEGTKDSIYDDIAILQELHRLPKPIPPKPKPWPFEDPTSRLSDSKSLPKPTPTPKMRSASGLSTRMSVPTIGEVIHDVRTMSLAQIKKIYNEAMKQREE